MYTGNLRALLVIMVTAAACSDGSSTGPATFTLTASHDRITTPGRITFTAQTATPLTRLEIYDAGRKVGESVATETPNVATVTVTRSDNGTRQYIGRGYREGTSTAASDPIPVEVDIRWDELHPLERTLPGAVAWGASGVLYAKYHTPTPDISVLLTRHEADGSEGWVRTFGGPDWEFSGSHGVDPSGRVFMAGTITYRSAGSQPMPDCFLVLYDPAGETVWSRQLATPAVERDCIVASDVAGNLYVAGSTATGTTWALMLAKFDALGTRLWSRQYPIAIIDVRDQPTVIAIDPLGGVYVGGVTLGTVDGEPNRGRNDVFVAKFDADGNNAWTKQYGTIDSDYVLDMAADPEGGIYVTGYRDPHPGFEHPEVDAFVLRYGPDGALLWHRELDGGGRDHGWAVAADGSAVYLLGATRSAARTPDFSEPRQGDLDVFLAKLSRTGELLWVRLLGGEHADTPSGFELVLGANGGVTIALQSSDLFPGRTGHVTVIARHRDAPP